MSLSLSVLKLTVGKRTQLLWSGSSAEARPPLLQPAPRLPVHELDAQKRTTSVGGVEIIYTVRDQSELPDLPAIALTAYALSGEKKKLHEERFDAHVWKPFTKVTLISTIDIPTIE